MARCDYYVMLRQTAYYCPVGRYRLVYVILVFLMCAFMTRDEVALKRVYSIWTRIERVTYSFVFAFAE